MENPTIRAGFVGFGEINSPRDLIERKCRAAARTLEACGVELVYTEPVRDDPAGAEEARARAELSRADFDYLVVCVAGWIPSQTVINVISPFIQKPIALWGLAGQVEGNRLVTTADQAGTSALRDPLDALGFRFRYFYDCPDGPVSAAEGVAAFGRVAQAAHRLRGARVGLMGNRDMNLYATLLDGVSVRRVIGPEVENFDTLEIVQRMEAVAPAEVSRVMGEIRHEWTFDEPAADATLEQGVRMYLAVTQKARERRYEAVSLIDVDGVKKLLRFPPAMVLKLLADKGGVASIPENDGPGAITQLIVRYLTGQVGAYFEFYEFMTDRLLLGVPDYVPSAVVDGPVHVRPCAFGGFSGGVLDVSRVRTGPATLCRLAGRGDRYRMHIATGMAVTPRRWEEAGWAPPAPQLPGIEFILDGPVNDFAQNVLGQHYIIAYGDHRRALADLCRLLGVEVI